MLATRECAAVDNRPPPIYHQPTPGAVLRVTEGRPIGRARAFPPGPPGRGRCCVASGVAARSMAVADGGRRLRQWSARSMRVTPSCPRPSAAPIARARGRSVEGTCVGRGATATRGRGRRGRALIVRAPSKPAGEFANAPLHRLGCSLGSAVRHGRGLGLAARGTSGRAVGRACGGGGRAATGGQERPRAHCAQGGGFLMTHNGHPALPGALNVNALGTTHNAAHAVHIALLWPPP